MRGKRLVLVLSILAIVLAVIYYLLNPPVYTSEAEIISVTKTPLPN